MLESLRWKTHSSYLFDAGQRRKWCSWPLRAVLTASKYAFKYIGEGVKDINGKSVDEIVKECDKDGNGVIDFKEFKDCVMKKWFIIGFIHQK